MKNSRKKIIAVVSIAAAIAVAAILILNSSEVKMFFAWMQLGEEADHRSYTSGFDENYESFQSLADYIIGNSDLRGDEGIVSIDETNKDKLSLMVFKGYENVTIPISDDIERDIAIVQEAFLQDNVSLTMFQSDGENRVAFVVLDEEYAIVYMKNDEKPDFAYPEEKNEGRSYTVTKLRDHWYAIATKGFLWGR